MGNLLLVENAFLMGVVITTILTREEKTMIKDDPK
jgi:hypothetical protein